MAARVGAARGAEPKSIASQSSETLNTFHAMRTLLGVDVSELALLPLVKQACDAVNWTLVMLPPTTVGADTANPGAPSAAATAGGPAPASLNDEQQLLWYRRLIASARDNPPKGEPSPWLTLPLNPKAAKRPAAGAGAGAGSGQSARSSGAPGPDEFMVNMRSGHIAVAEHSNNSGNSASGGAGAGSDRSGATGGASGHKKTENSDVALAALAPDAAADADTETLSFTTWWHEGSLKRTLRLLHHIHSETFTVSFAHTATEGLAAAALASSSAPPGLLGSHVRPTPLSDAKVTNGKGGKVTCWDLYVGARVVVFGRPVTLMTCSAETGAWIEAHAKRLLDMKAGLEKHLSKYESPLATVKGCVYHGATDASGSTGSRTERRLIHCHLRLLVAEVVRLRARLARFRPELASKYEP